MSYDLEDFAERLREARNAKHLSQRELSKLAGVPQAHISRIESKQVDLRLSSLIAIANALDLEVTLVPRQALPAVQPFFSNLLPGGHLRQYLASMAGVHPEPLGRQSIHHRTL